MPPGTAEFYAEFRLRSGLVSRLRDDSDSPPEQLLQAVWQHQRIRRDQLTCLDGQTVRVLHPGFLNRESGPDFRDALVQFGDDPPRSGDIEVDLRSSGWRAHGHYSNPAFNSVILHVVWESERLVHTSPPTLPLRQVLDAPIGQLALWLGGEPSPEISDELRGKCCPALASLTDSQQVELLHQAALVRFQGKASQLEARARQAGWEQALWEGLFRALGYRHNTWPMLRLAETRPLWGARVSGLLPLQARLLGISGLLPSDLTPTQAKGSAYLRQVWDLWWRERHEFADCALPRAVWRLHGIRPANHPARRLALASHWLCHGHLVTRLERWCRREIQDAGLAASLLSELDPGPDEFWSSHWSLQSARLTGPKSPLLGQARLTDLAINVVLPWLWIRAIEGKNESIRKTIEHRYFAWPAAEDNSALRRARSRLLGAGRAGSPSRPAGAAMQQGLLQVARDFCDQSNSVCDGCKMPELARMWAMKEIARP